VLLSFAVQHYKFIQPLEKGSAKITLNDRQSAHIVVLTDE